MSGILSAIFCSAQDGKQGALGVLNDRGKCGEFLLNEKSRDFVRKRDSGDTRVGPVGCSEGIVYIDISEFAEALTETGHLGRIGFYAAAFCILGLALFLNVEADIFKKDDITRLDGGAG